MPNRILWSSNCGQFLPVRQDSIGVDSGGVQVGSRQEPTSGIELNGFGDGLGSSLAGTDGTEIQLRMRACLRGAVCSRVLLCSVPACSVQCACFTATDQTNRRRCVDINTNQMDPVQIELCVVRCVQLRSLVACCALRVQKHDSHTARACA